MRCGTFLLLPLFLTACTRGAGAAAGAREGWLALDGEKGLVFVWRQGDGFQTAYSVRDVPSWARGRVRVLHPGRAVQPGTALVVDLCRQRADGRYPYRVVALRDFESAPAKGCGGKAEGPAVVVYMSSTCPVCKRAMVYLRQRGIPFVAKDVQADPAAAAELARKAARAGVQVQGVPVFDVGGRLIQGFDPQRIEALLGGRKP